MIFVVGMSRSGTTLVGRILGTDDTVHTFEELHFFENIALSDDIKNQRPIDREQAIGVAVRLLTSAAGNFFHEPDYVKWEKTASEIVDRLKSTPTLGSVYLATLKWYTLSKGRSVICEQTPRYIFCVKEIMDLVPHAKFINLIRDPRDVMLSQKNKWRTYKHGTWSMPFGEAVRVWANYSPIVQALMWRSCIKCSDQLSGESKFLNVRFEDLLNNPETEIRRMCKHAELKFSKQMLTADKIGSSITPDEKGARGIDSTFTERWKQGGISNREILICEMLCGEQMADHGYLPHNLKYPKLAILASLPELVLKGSIMVFLNRNRSKSLLNFLRNRLGF